MICTDIDKLEDAIEFFIQSLYYYRKIFGDKDDNLIVFRVLYNLGDVFFKNKNFEIALDYYQYCLDIMKLIDSSNNLIFSSLYYQIGEIFNKFNKYDESLSNYQNSFNILRSIYGYNDYEGISIVLNSIIQLVKRQFEFENIIN